MISSTWMETLVEEGLDTVPAEVAVKVPHIVPGKYKRAGLGGSRQCQSTRLQNLILATGLEPRLGVLLE
jgi:hypothetical protein